MSYKNWWQYIPNVHLRSLTCKSVTWLIYRYICVLTKYIVPVHRVLLSCKHCGIVMVRDGVYGAVVGRTGKGGVTSMWRREDNYLRCGRDNTFGPARVLCEVIQVIAWYYRSSRVTDSLFTILALRAYVILLRESCKLIKYGDLACSTVLEKKL